MTGGKNKKEKVDKTLTRLPVHSITILLAVLEQEK